ncbi:MAG: DoxX family membrane protein [Euryarchaeota archaeon]|nr:DoxX family membrane protein [Euryarchaeota archaeon]
MTVKKTDSTTVSNIEYVTDPPFVRDILDGTKWAWAWVVIRLYLGYEWVNAGLHKVGDPKWVGDGTALKAFWERAVAMPAAPGRPPISFDWYRDFINFLVAGGHYSWFAKVVVAGELLIGVALIVGAFVGIAACFGAFMNWNFMMAGTASSNPMLLLLAILLILAWKTAGWIGLDRYLLPMLGTPWRPGKVFTKGEGR